MAFSIYFKFCFNIVAVCKLWALNSIKVHFMLIFLIVTLIIFILWFWLLFSCYCILSTYHLQKKVWWLILKSTKALAIKTSIVFNLVLLTISLYALSLFFFLKFWLIIFSYCTCYTYFNSTSELMMSLRIPTSEVKAETEKQPLIAETNIRNDSIEFKIFLCFLFIKFFYFISLWNNFLFDQFLLI